MNKDITQHSMSLTGNLNTLEVDRAKNALTHEYTSQITHGAKYVGPANQTVDHLDPACNMLKEK